VAIAADYTSAAAGTPQQAGELFTRDIKETGDLIQAYTASRETFRQAWLKENQHYWLDSALTAYDKKINRLTRLRETLKQNKTFAANGHSLSPAGSSGLLIRESTNYYFQNWMLAGPFLLSDQDKFPDYLYSDNPEYNKPPSPGDFTQFRGKLYRWKKFASTDGGIIDPGGNYSRLQPVMFYAYCSITSDSAKQVPAFIRSDAALEIYCNGRKLSEAFSEADAAKEIREDLPLKAGVNQILLKFRETGEPGWTFTFRLRDHLAITNHKHKYQLNAKTVSYDEE
jgi:hypothetical protein